MRVKATLNIMSDTESESDVMDEQDFDMTVNDQDTYFKKWLMRSLLNAITTSR